MTTTPKSRWFQFSIREVALLMLALGFALAWWRKREAWAPIREEIGQVSNGSAISISKRCELGGARLFFHVARDTDPDPLTQRLGQPN